MKTVSLQSSDDAITDSNEYGITEVESTVNEGMDQCVCSIDYQGLIDWLVLRDRKLNRSCWIWWEQLTTLLTCLFIVSLESRTSSRPWTALSDTTSMPPTRNDVLFVIASIRACLIPTIQSFWYWGTLIDVLRHVKTEKPKMFAILLTWSNHSRISSYQWSWRRLARLNYVTQTVCVYMSRYRCPNSIVLALQQYRLSLTVLKVYH